MQVKEIQLSEIKGSPFDLRSETRDNDPELLQSIKEHGLKQPILIRPKGRAYQVVAGVRRLNAFKILGRKSISSIVENVDDKTAFEIALTENIQRRNMEPIEEGRAFNTYLDKYKWGSTTELAKRINRRPSYIVDRLTLIESPKEVQRLVEREKISPSHVEELSRLGRPQDKVDVAKAVVDEKLTRDQTSEVVDLVKDRKMPVERAVQIVKIEERAREAAEEVADSLKHAIVESGREIEKLRSSEQRKLMENYVFLGTIIQALGDGRIFCSKHKEEKSMLKWACGTSISETYQSLKQEMRLK